MNDNQYQKLKIIKINQTNLYLPLLSSVSHPFTHFQPFHFTIFNQNKVSTVILIRLLKLQYIFSQYLPLIFLYYIIYGIMNQIKYEFQHNHHLKTSQHFNYELQCLHNDITQLQNKFLRFRIVLSSLNTMNSPLKIINLPQINDKIKGINEMVYIFISNFQKQLRQMRKCIMLMMDEKNQAQEFIVRQRQRCSNMKDQVIDQKLRRLEKCLKQHEDKQSKLIGTINFLLDKYKKNQDLHFIQNDGDIKYKVMKPQIQPFTENVTLHNHSYTQEQIKRNRPKTQSQKHMSFVNKYNSDTIIRNQSPLQFKRTTAKVGICGKISLKGGCEKSKRQASPLHAYNHNKINKIIRSNSMHKQRRSESTQTHDHRFAMMIKKLHQ